MAKFPQALGFELPKVPKKSGGGGGGGGEELSALKAARAASFARVIGLDFLLGDVVGRVHALDFEAFNANDKLQPLHVVVSEANPVDREGPNRTAVTTAGAGNMRGSGAAVCFCCLPFALNRSNRSLRRRTNSLKPKPCQAYLERRERVDAAFHVHAIPLVCPRSGQRREQHEHRLPGV